MAQTEDMPVKEIFVLDDDLWEALMDLTAGAIALCYQCGVCTATCPWGFYKREPLSVRTLLRRAQLGIEARNDSLWLCTTCAQCQANCPRGVDVVDVFRGIRHLAWERRNTPEGLPSLLWSVYWNNNPWSQPPSKRSIWANNLNVPIFNPQEHEVLFYIGCTSAFNRRTQKIARSLLHLLQAANVRFGYLGDEEPCCGESVLSLGHGPYFREIAEQNAQIFQDRGVTRVITISPHCFDVFKNNYPRLGDEFQPFHYTQYLAKLVNEDRLKLQRPIPKRITFQDPCYLSRHNKEYEAPRQIMNNLPGINFVEMDNHGVDGLCCGGGGGRMWLETVSGQRFSDIQIKHATQIGAQILVTACPFCTVCLEDSAKVLEANDLLIMDLAELTALTLTEYEEIPSW